MKPLSTVYSSVHLRLWTHPSRRELGNLGVTYKLLWCLKYSNSSLLHWDWVYLSLTVWRILLRSRLSLARHDLGYILRMPFITWCDDFGASTTRAENISPAVPNKNVSIPHLTSIIGPDTWNPSRFIISLGAQAR